MGRHAAADGAGTDPIVAAALAQQQDTGAAALRHATAETTADPATESGLGWPGDTTTGGGLGWPGSTDTAADDVRDADADAADGAGDAVDATTRMDAVPAVPGPRESAEDAPAGDVADDDVPDGQPARRGWRRMFGGTAA
jgi:hypothetical protein